MSKQIGTLVSSIFEEQLDKIVSTIGVGPNTLYLLGELVEDQYTKGNFFQGENIRTAIEVLIPKIMKEYNPRETMKGLNPENMIKVITFASAFWDIRDLIAYTLGAKGTISWEKNGRNIKAKIIDPTIYRQYVAEHQAFILNSSTKYDSDNSHSDLINLLKGTSHFGLHNPNVVAALKTIEKIVDWKIDNYFSYIPPDSNVLLDGYRYSDFFIIYRQLLFFAIYERYFATANRLSKVMTYKEEELIRAIQKYSPIKKGHCIKILRDISKSSRATFNFIEKERKYFLFPFCFSLVDGITNILRQFAQRDSDAFSASIGHIIGDALVVKIKKDFEQFHNYRVHTDVLLYKYDERLPDIDILAISYQPKLGFHFIACEAKNNLPAMCGRQYLSAQYKKGFLNKALSQVSKTREFMLTEKGQKLLIKLAMSSFSHIKIKALFPAGLYIKVEHLVITSQSVGMFFPKKDAFVISSELLHHIINSSDGDADYILSNIKNLNRDIDKCYKKTTQKIKVGGYSIKIDNPKLKGYISLPEHKYSSISNMEHVKGNSLESGYHIVDWKTVES